MTPPHYLGPTIAATKDKPVRIVFRNLLPTGADGDLFLPTDTLADGLRHGPDGAWPTRPTRGTVTDDVRNPMCTQSPRSERDMCFKDNRATLHLHGGTTPWISDGTPHQWITPAGETTTVAAGRQRPERPRHEDAAGATMCDAKDDGCQTFFYTNQQSARLMFYHDHAWGITRLNVYAGEAAGYLLTDADRAEADRHRRCRSPASASALRSSSRTRPSCPAPRSWPQQDPTWDTPAWGGEGNLWYHHVYMPAQNPGDPSGMSAFGRWMYGPWFWPPANGHEVRADRQPVLRRRAATRRPATWQYQTDPFCEPELIPGTPNISVGMEQFNDTPIVNGTAYPTTTVDPKAYRFRILNAANDRFWNLSVVRRRPDHRHVSEVALKPAELAAAQTDPIVFPTPDTTLQPGRARLDPDRHRGRLPAGPGRRSAPADDLDHRPDPVRRRQRRPALAAAGSGRAGRRDRRLLEVRGQDADPLQRRARRVPGPRPRLRLLHRWPGPEPGRRADHPARLRPQHPHHHAGQDRGQPHRRRRST